MKSPAELMLIVCLLWLMPLHAQENPPAIYQDYVHQADSLAAAGQYAKAASKYSAAFESFGWKGVYTDRINAAQSWAQAGVPDSAFFVSNASLSYPLTGT